MSKWKTALTVALIAVFVGLSGGLYVRNKELRSEVSNQAEQIESLNGTVRTQAEEAIVSEQAKTELKASIDSNNSKIDSLEKEVKSLR